MNVMGIFTTLVATLDNHMLIRRQEEVSSGMNFKVTSDNQPACDWIIDKWQAYGCDHRGTGSGQHSIGKPDALPEISQQWPVHTAQLHPHGLEQRQ